ncbi:MAG TPA: hypothetical protein V6D06_13275 [Trichocoleus sp.]
MIRKFSASLLALTLVWSSVACSSVEDYSTSQPTQPVPQETTVPVAASSITDGTYPVQQATYDDSSGEYSLVLLNTAPGQSMFHAANLPLARLTDEEISAGKLSELRVENGQPALYLTPDFRIEYVHNVTETQVDPQTGQQEVVIVRREPSFWTPFAGALAGQAIGNLLFRPHYYMPPLYQPGVALVGYGGYGRNYTEAVSRYQSRYQAPPAEYRNRQFRASGRLRPATGTAPRVNANRPSGSGFGNSTLRRSTRRTERARPSGGGFGSSRRSAPRRSFGGRRR